jgi:hypothetical protein
VTTTPKVTLAFVMEDHDTTLLRITNAIADTSNQLKQTIDLKELRPDRKKLDVEYFKLYGVWRFKRKKFKKLKCTDLLIQDKTKPEPTQKHIYQFGYKNFPKNLLYEIKSGTRLGAKAKKVYIFVRPKQMALLDPLIWTITNQKIIDKSQWKRMQDVLSIDQCIQYRV